MAVAALNGISTDQITDFFKDGIQKTESDLQSMMEMKTNPSAQDLVTMQVLMNQYSTKFGIETEVIKSMQTLFRQIVQNLGS